MKELIERAIQINKELVAKIEEMKITELFKNEISLFEADDKYFTCEVDGVKTKGYISIIHAMGGYVIEYCTLRGSKLPIDVNSEKPFNEQMIKDLNITNLKLWDYLPKEGEYFYVKAQMGYAFIAIAKNGEDLTSRFVSLNQDNGRLNYDESGCVCSELFIEELRPATPQEIALLDAKLKENGQYFDQELMSIKDIVNEPVKPAFKVGDWVLITKPKNVQQKPYWTSSMDKYDGKTIMIEGFNSDGYIVIDSWKFNSDWCTKVEAQKSFKVGDWFIPKKPEDFYNSPVYWDFKMDKFIGKKLKIEAITTSGMLLSNDWKFHPDWCTKVDAPKSETMVNELKEYFKNTPKAQVVKDWEATREFDKAPKPNKLEVGDICIFWDDNKSNAVIGKLTKINYESDLPYEAIDILVYKNCIKFESMEQYNEFIEV